MRYVNVSFLLAGLLFNVYAAGNDALINLRRKHSETTEGRLIPWTGDELELLEQPPLFELQSAASETRARGWMSAHIHGFIMSIMVRDDRHVNTRQGADIWDGDAIQLGIDADGSGVGSRDPGSAFVGPNDASITVALTRQGPRAWAHYHGNPHRRGAIRDMDMHITRDEDAQQTRYSLYFNWSDFQLKPGISEKMGVAVQVNDTDDGPQQLRLKWGDGAGGNLRPGLFRTVRLDIPDEEFVSILPYKTNVWTADDSMQILIAA